MFKLVWLRGPLSKTSLKILFLLLLSLLFLLFSNVLFLLFVFLRCAALRCGAALRCAALCPVGDPHIFKIIIKSLTRENHIKREIPYKIQSIVKANPL